MPFIQYSLVDKKCKTTYFHMVVKFIQIERQIDTFILEYDKECMGIICHQLILNVTKNRLKHNQNWKHLNNNENVW